MRPVRNKNHSLICPKHKNCRNDWKFSSDTICGHHIPHCKETICGVSKCGVETDTACTPVGDEICAQ